jgi:beta-lactamase regulating signal transducer with metallopeptidase domain
MNALWYLTPPDLRYGAIALAMIAKSALILVGAAAIVLMLRRSSAAVRHGIWTSALAATLALPLLSVTLPAWSWAVLPTATTPVIEPAAHIDLVSIPTPNQMTARMPEINAAIPPVATSVPAPARAVAASASMPIPARPARPVWPWIAAIWMFGACIVLSIPMLGRLLLGRTIRRANRLDHDEWAGLKATLAVRRRVDLYQGDRAQMPMTWGLLRPVVLIPNEFDVWTPERRRDVLLHELAHVRRFDCLTQALAQLACAAYWFNPLAWIAAARMRVERERACDDLVLTLGGLPSEYAGSLLEMARKLRSGRAAALAAVSMARPSQLEGRLLAVLDPNRPRGGFSRHCAFLASLGFAIVLLPISVVRLSAQAVKSADTSKLAQAVTKGTSEETMIVAGRVLDPDGKPVKGAKLDIYGRPKSRWEGDPWNLPEIVMMGHAASGENGRFQLTIPRTSAADYFEIRVLASAQGFGVVEGVLAPDAERPVIELQLEPEQIRTVKLVDEAGKPAANLPVTLIGMYREGPKNPAAFAGYNLNFSGFPGASGWPAPEPTDAEGRLRLTRIGPGFRIVLFVRDSRFARQRLIMEPVDPSKPKEDVFTLKAARIIEGRILAADTGRPVANAEIGINGITYRAIHEPDITAFSPFDRFQADREGRYRMNLPAADEYRLVVYPPSGEPYPIHEESLKWAEGSTKMHHDVKVPRGVLVRGKVAESGSGRPLAGARVESIPSQSTPSSPVFSGEDGSFQLAVAPGKEHLLICGPTRDFVAESIDPTSLYGRPTHGERRYAHKIIPYEVKSGERPTPVVVELRPSLTVRGRAVGPLGQPIEKVILLSSLDFDAYNGWWGSSRRDPLRDGRFEVRGVSPDSKARVWLFDPEHEWGATFEVDAQDARRETKVMLEPCGRATARLVAPDGSPRTPYKLNIEFLAASSSSTDNAAAPVGQGQVEANACPMNWVDPKRYTEAPSTDSEGRITYPALIPGAFYRIRDVTNSKGSQIRKDFSVKSGETLDLGDILIERPQQP